MTIHDEFLEILRILTQDPQPSAKKPSEPQRSSSARVISHECGNRKRKEAAS
jgi:hypothetical protein